MGKVLSVDTEELFYTMPPIISRQFVFFSHFAVYVYAKFISHYEDVVLPLGKLRSQGQSFICDEDGKNRYFGQQKACFFCQPVKDVSTRTCSSSSTTTGTTVTVISVAHSGMMLA